MRFLLCHLLFFALSGPVFAETIDRIVAVVEEEVVLWSEVQLESELSHYIGDRSPFWSHERSDATSRLIEASMLRQLASGIALYAPPEEQVRAELESMRMQFADRTSWLAFLHRHGLDEESLRTWIRRRLVVDRYLARNLDTSVDDRSRWKEAFDPLMARVRLGARVRRIEHQAP